MDSHQQPMNFPLVSVIVPAYNAETFIERTLNSVLSQTYKNIEVLVVDDGSSDRTAEIVRAIAQQDSRVVLLHQQNSGVAAARNLAIQKSQGEFIAPIDADDLWYPENIEKQVQCFLDSDPSVGLVYTWSVDIDEDDLLTGGFRAAKIEGEVYTTLVCHNFLGNASASMIRRTCLEKVAAYDCNMRAQNAQGCEDWDLYLRIAEHYQFRVVPEFLIGYRKLSSSMSGDYSQMARSHSLILQTVRQKHPEFSGVIYRLSRSNLYMYFAHQSNRCGRHKTTISWLYEALKADLVTPFLRYGLYRLLIQSSLGLIRHSTRNSTATTQASIPEHQRHQLHPKVMLSINDIKNRKIMLLLMIKTGDIFHNIVNIIAKFTTNNKQPDVKIIS
jgi:glycosyltransferase involved in cell wall biosynthesis